MTSAEAYDDSIKGKTIYRVSRGLYAEGICETSHCAWCMRIRVGKKIVNTNCSDAFFTKAEALEWQKSLSRSYRNEFIEEITVQLPKFTKLELKTFPGPTAKLQALAEQAERMLETIVEQMREVEFN